MVTAIAGRNTPYSTAATQRTDAELRNAELARAFWEAPDQAMFPAEIIAAVRRVSTLTLGVERYSGRGPAYYKPGKTPLYKKKDVVAFIEEARNEPGK